jgi:hypothetical protein
LYSDVADGLCHLRSQIFLIHESFLPYGFGSILAHFLELESDHVFAVGKSISNELEPKFPLMEMVT